MYSRPPNNRFPRGMRVPENYSGNAFGTASDIDKEIAAIGAEAEEDEKILNEESTPSFSSNSPEHEQNALPASSTSDSKESRPSFSLNLGRFFPTNRSFGMEEFLIIALILLLAQNDTDDDTLIFLILLLFIK